MMGRAEKRMAKKRAAKGPQYQGGRPLQQSDRTDKVPRSAVLKRLNEVPVFGLRVLQGSSAGATEAGYLADDDGIATLYMDARDAERDIAQRKMEAELRVTAVSLDDVFFDKSTRLVSSQRSMDDLATIPAERALVPDVRTPLFAIDGFQTKNEETGVDSLPLFFSKADLLNFANPVYGSAEAKKKVLVTDLEVVVTNMINGPAGLLRNARFFCDARSHDWLEEDARGQQSAPTTLLPPKKKPSGGGGGLFPSGLFP